MPEVRLNSLSGGPAISTGEWVGTPLVINIWATWCRPCREEMPSLEGLSRRLSGQGVRVIGVSVDDDFNLAAEFVRRHGLTFPVYADGDLKPFRSMLRAKTLPETILVGADGGIAARVPGARDWSSAETDALLQRMLDLRLADRR